MVGSALETTMEYPSRDEQVTRKYREHFDDRSGRNSIRNRNLSLRKAGNHHLEWEDYAAAKDMSYLLKIRKAVLGLLEEARGHKRVKSSLEAEVDILLPNKGGNHPVVELLKREEQILKTLFITLDACLFDEGSLGSGSQSSAWVYTESLDLGEDFGEGQMAYVWNFWRARHPGNTCSACFGNQVLMALDLYETLKGRNYMCKMCRCVAFAVNWPKGLEFARIN
ncbi:hypothetical protein C8J55DRAFT_591101 [Lentinula edodes]|uniref:Uncharacterized protein n=1 Tax=Lentinula lateritia TaxID=40482 RepID=A0A9W9AXR6_9AGAR|nr:hypothetical protein C8J55DRAFT_591101 [Lentinula edodes]